MPAEAETCRPSTVNDSILQDVVKLTVEEARYGATRKFQTSPLILARSGLMTSTRQ
jgi:hypothetical protein